MILPFTNLNYMFEQILWSSIVTFWIVVNIILCWTMYEGKEDDAWVSVFFFIVLSLIESVVTGLLYKLISDLIRNDMLYIFIPPSIVIGLVVLVGIIVNLRKIIPKKPKQIEKTVEDFSHYQTGDFKKEVVNK